MRICDTAVCLSSKNGKIDFKEWEKEAEKNGITHSVLVPPKEYISVYNEEGNFYIGKAVKQNRNKYSGLAVANPWYGGKAVRVLKTAFEAGLSGLYINPALQGAILTDKLYKPLLEECVLYKKNVYVHTGTPVFSMPFQLLELAREFKKLTFVMGHASWSDFWYDVIPAAKMAKNIVIEVSCTGGTTVKGLIEELGAERVLYGSGYPESLPEVEIAKIKRLKFGKTAINKIMYANAKKVWGIKE